MLNSSNESNLQYEHNYMNFYLINCKIWLILKLSNMSEVLETSSSKIQKQYEFNHSSIWSLPFVALIENFAFKVIQLLKYQIKTQLTTLG